MNALADIMLIHRCYIIWGSNRILLYALSVVGIILNAISFTTATMVSVAESDLPKLRYVNSIAGNIDHGNMLAILVFNLLLSLLTAGRIWWITREARRQAEMPVQAKYKAIVAAILESGLLYPIALLASELVSLMLDPETRGKVPVSLEPISNLMAGLAPTLIIVRVAYGKSVDSVQQVITRTIHFAEQESQETRPGRSLSALRATVDIRSHQQTEDLEAHKETVNLQEKIDETRIV
ncbi:hypothetical protein PQX77_007280 [Marasmius sp. AFHP31]|nr:hypothetical protein PQX77_007280 [Marasmius sp. AFHP31]